MTGSGKRLSAILYGLVVIMVGLLALATLVAAAGIVWTWFNPQTLWDAPLHIRYADHAAIAWPNTAEARLTLCGVGLLLCGILATGLIPLLRLCHSAVAGNPFARENVGRLRMIALAFLLVALAQVAMPFVLPKAALILFQPAESHLDLEPLLAALVILILADVFREGVRLREDAEGTI